MCIRDSPNREGSFLNPDENQKLLKGAENIIVVCRGQSGIRWKPVNIFLNGLLLGKYLRKPRYGTGADKVFYVQPDEPLVKQDKQAYISKSTGEVVFGEPASVDEIRELESAVFDKKITVCTHDARGYEGFVKKICLKDKPWTVSGNPSEFSSDDETSLLENFDGFLYNIDASGVVTEYIKDVIERHPGTIVIEPDGSPFVPSKSIVKGRNACYGGALQKERRLDCEYTGSLSYNGGLGADLRDKSVLIVDDKIMTAGTMYNAAQMAIEGGARHLRLVGMHGEFHDRGNMDALVFLQDLRTQYKHGDNKVRIHTSNTVDNPVFHKPLDVSEIVVQKTHELI